MESIVLSHHAVVVHYALFSLTNASSLRQRLVAASTLPDDEHGTTERQALDFAFLDASMLTSRLHLLTAVSQALLNCSNAIARTHTIHSEILYALEPGTNISDSLKHFGLSHTTQHLCLVHVTPIPTESLGSINDQGKRVLRKMEALVQGGGLLSLARLGGLEEGFVNEKSLRKVGQIPPICFPGVFYRLCKRKTSRGIAELTSSGKKNPGSKCSARLVSVPPSTPQPQLYKLNQDPLLLKAQASNNPRASLKALDELVTSAVALKVVN